MPFDLVPLDSAPKRFDLVPIEPEKGADRIQQTLAGLANIIPTTLGLPADAARAMDLGGQKLADMVGLPITHDDKAANVLPTSENIRNGLSSALRFMGLPDEKNPYAFDPSKQDNLGKIAYAATSSINPLGPVSGAMSGGGGELLRQQYEGTPLEGAAQIVGSLGGGMSGLKGDALLGKVGLATMKPNTMPEGLPQDSNEAMRQIGKVLRGEYDDIKRQVGDAYTALREGGERGIKLVPDATARLSSQVEGTLQKGAYDFRGDGMRDVARLRDDLTGLMQRQTPATAGELEDWRTRLTQLANDAKGTTAGSAANAMKREYDNWFASVQPQELWNGQPEQWQKFANARALRAEQGARFPQGEIADIAVKPQTTPESLRDAFIGKGQVGANSDAANNLAAMLRAAGDKAVEVKQNATSGVLNRIQERNLNNGVMNWNGVALDTRSLLEQNESLANALLSPDEVKNLAYLGEQAKKAQQSGGLLSRAASAGGLGMATGAAGYAALGPWGGIMAAAPFLYQEGGKAIATLNAEDALARALLSKGGIVPAKTLSDAQRRVLLSTALGSGEKNTKEKVR